MGIKGVHFTGIALAALLVWVPAAFTQTIKIMDESEPAQSFSTQESAALPVTTGPQATASYEALEAEMESPIESLREVHEAASTAARTIGKSVGKTVGSYVKEKTEQFKRQALLAKFDQSLTDLTSTLRLDRQEYRRLVSEIEMLYIDDAVSGRNELDQVHFHELPRLVKKVYADICLGRTQEGTVDTYNLDGSLKSRWTFRSGKPDGAVITYYKDGEIRFIDLYRQGQRLKRQKYDEEGKLIFSQDYSYEIPAEEKPQAPAETVSKENSEAPL